MSNILYTPKRFSQGSLDIINAANRICLEWARQGYDLTLRQLYYQFVARGLIANKQSEYKRLGSVINDARLAGMLDWDYIVDRTRNVEVPASWEDPASIVQAAADSYRIDRWEGQPYKVEVWVEKEALAGIVERATSLHRVPWFSCRGYTSQSELWGAAQRLRRYIRRGQMPIILHLGDHDPSGIDMTRDIMARLELFMTQDWYNDDMVGVEGDVYTSTIREHMVQYLRDQHEEPPALRANDMPVIVERIALNIDQVETFDPPPNPTKFTDSRAGGYIERYGYSSWELDALSPSVLNDLIREHIEDYLDEDLYEEKLDQEEAERAQLREIVADLEGAGEEE